jgi:hypothetical protein
MIYEVRSANMQISDIQMSCDMQIIKVKMINQCMDNHLHIRTSEICTFNKDYPIASATPIPVPIRQSLKPG